MINPTGRSLLAYTTREELQELIAPAKRTIRRVLVRFGLAQKDHVDEVLQESLKNLVQCLASGKPVQNAPAYFKAICRNTALNYGRAVIRRRRMEEQLTEALEGLIPLSDESLVDEDPRLQAAREALATLSPRSRRILEFMYIDGLDSKEIQALLGCTDGALRIAKLRALRALREAMKELQS